MRPLGRAAVLLTLAALVAGGCSGAPAGPPSRSPFAGTTPAPEFPGGLDWLNTERPLSLAALRGKVVLLDFWTYGCINCIHIIPDLKRLEAEFGDELVVVGVHSAKFDNEADTENLRRAVVRYGLEHPVVADADFAVWQSYRARAWPTVVLIDPDGNIVSSRAGEGVYESFRPQIEGVVALFDGRGSLDRTPLALKLEAAGRPGTVLAFPGKVLADPGRGRLFVADTGHHRIVVADTGTGEILDVAGSGRAGFVDGGFASASFDSPQGMAISDDGGTLYVADSGNHSVRALDLGARTVGTLAGTGEQAGTYPPLPGVAPGVALSSPWDLALDGSRLYVAMAGAHQIWAIDLDTGISGPVAGSGREGVVDGEAEYAQLAQPSGLALDGGGRLYWADSESSTIRYLEIAEGGAVHHLAGSGNGLFDFGYADGAARDALFQHPLGVAWDGQWVYVADTYNSKVRRVDPASGSVTTMAGGAPGWADGPEPRFDEPGGIHFAGGLLYVADTNNSAIRVVDPGTGEARTLVLYGIEEFDASAGAPAIPVVALDPVTLAPGEGSLAVEVSLPPGYKLNGIAPFSLEWGVGGGVVAVAADADRSLVAPAFPIEVGAGFTAGSGVVTADLIIYYCEAEVEELCFLDRVRLELPVEVRPGGAARAVLRYAVPAPPA
jgi:DNA-binding beta-propeller fold protein YncE